MLQVPPPNSELSGLKPSASQQAPVALEQIVINEALESRPARVPDYRSESEAFVKLSQSMANSPSEILQKLADVTMELCGAESAGISVLENEDGSAIFRWCATAGRLKPFLHATMPRDFSPCGLVVDTCQPQLMAGPIRYYTYVADLGLPIEEVLLVPFMQNGRAAGTVWAVAHGNRKKFDREDLRLLTALSSFTAAGYQISLMLERERKHRKIATEERFAAEKLAQELALAKDVAQEATRAKSAFLANMSHEMRTPLGVIMGFSELGLQGDQSPAEMSAALRRIYRNAAHLKVLVDDILDLAKVEADKFEPQFVEFSVQMLLTDLAENFSIKAHEKNLRFNSIQDPSVPERIVTDPTRLRQILTNLVGNAIKFTDRGEVKLTFCLIESGGRRFLQFDVEDSGIGMTPRQTEDLFIAFSQVHGPNPRKFQGTGLGLMLSRKLARSLGGEVELITTSPGSGSHFRGSVECQPFCENPPRVEVSRRAGQKRLNGLKVLLVEDSADNQELISRYLKMAGAEVSIADNGALGVEAALNGDCDLVLMDIQMPVMEGDEAVSVLRAKNFAKPVIALTAHAMRGERERSMKAGFTDYLVKPIDRIVMVETIAGIMALRN